MTRETLTLPTETIARAMAALNGLTVASTTYRHAPAPKRTEQEAVLVQAEQAASAASREMNTMVSFALNTPDRAETLELALREVRETRDNLRSALRNIAGICSDQYQGAQKTIERIHDVASQALGGK